MKDSLYNKLIQKEIEFDICYLSPHYGRDIQRKDDVDVNSINASIFFSKLWDSKTNTDLSIATKMFIISPEECYGPEKYGKSLLDFTKSYKYEADMYKYIFENIISTNQSPNFIGFVGYAECKLDKDNIPDFMINKLFARIADYEAHNKLKKQCVNTDNLRVGMLITQKPKNVQALQFSQFFTNYTLPNREAIIRPILFQLFYAIYIFQQHKITHNDLHDGNILVETLDEPVNLRYKIGDYIFNIRTNHKVYIFDWDLSYREPIKNDRLENIYCGMFAMCNVFDEYKDVEFIISLLKEYQIEVPFPRTPFTEMLDGKKFELQLDGDMISSLIANSPVKVYIDKPFLMKPKDIKDDKILTFLRELNINEKNGGMFIVTADMKLCLNLVDNPIKYNTVYWQHLDFNILDLLLYYGNKSIFDFCSDTFYEYIIRDKVQRDNTNNILKNTEFKSNEFLELYNYNANKRYEHILSVSKVHDKEYKELKIILFKMVRNLVKLYSNIKANPTDKKIQDNFLILYFEIKKQLLGIYNSYIFTTSILYEIIVYILYFKDKNLVKLVSVLLKTKINQKYISVSKDIDNICLHNINTSKQWYPDE